jgi:predicted Zn finger-like uncharacterized protein
MIIECQTCHARFRLDESRIKGRGARVKCRKCGDSIVVLKGGAPEPAPPSPGGDGSFDLSSAVRDTATFRPPVPAHGRKPDPVSGSVPAGRACGAGGPRAGTGKGRGGPGLRPALLRRGRNPPGRRETGEAPLRRRQRICGREAPASPSPLRGWTSGRDPHSSLRRLDLLPPMPGAAPRGQQRAEVAELARRGFSSAIRDRISEGGLPASGSKVSP